MIAELRWNINYEISALLFLTVVAISFFIKKNLPTRMNRLYRNLLIASLAAVIFDILTVFTISYSEALPVSLNIAVNLIYLILINFIPALFFLYVHEVTRPVRASNTLLFAVLFAPIVFSGVALLVSPFTGFVFYFDSERQYHWGPGMLYLYVISEYFILLSLAYIVRFRKAISLGKRLVLYFFILSSIFAVVFQFFFPAYLILGLASSVAMLLLYLSLQNPEYEIDSGTGTFNRLAFITSLNLMTRQGKPFQIITAALDDFKFINNTFGISNGDTLIRSVGEFLYRTAPAHSAYRIGGDQFAVLVPSPAEAGSSMLEQLVSRFSHPWDVNGVNASLSATISVLEFPEDARSVEEIIDGIDFSILEAKKQRKGSVIKASEISVHPGKRSAEVEKAIRDALQNNGFSIFYQPIHSVAEKRCVSLEALIRLKDPVLGNISPDEFIPLSEKNGLIVQIGFFVFESVCRYIVEEHLADRGIKYVEVNLSAVQCMQVDLADQLLAIMKRYSIPPTMINLEVTETTAINSPEALMRSMKLLGAQGVTFALDDYGSGYSTLDYVTSYTFTLVKIDKSIVWSFMDNPKAGIVLAHTIRMIKALDMHIVAEGVETIEQSDALVSMGCDYLQGYYYSRPLSGSDLPAYLEKEAP